MIVYKNLSLVFSTIQRYRDVTLAVYDKPIIGTSSGYYIRSRQCGTHRLYRANLNLLNIHHGSERESCPVFHQHSIESCSAINKQIVSIVDQQVITGAAMKGISACAATQQIIAATAIERIIPGRWCQSDANRSPPDALIPIELIVRRRATATPPERRSDVP